LLKYLADVFCLTSSKESVPKFKFASLKRLIPYVKPHWKKALFGSLFMIVLSFLALPPPYLMKLVVDKAFIAKSISVLNIVVIILIGLQLITVLFSLLTEYHFNAFSQEIMVKIRKDLFYKILRLPLSFFDKNQTGYILSRIGEVEGLSFFFSNTLVRVTTSFFEFIFCLTILFYLNWQLAVISLLILPIYFFIFKICSRAFRNLARESFEKGAIIFRQIQDSLSGVEVIKYFVAEKRESERIYDHLNEMKAISIKRNMASAIVGQFVLLMGSLSGFMILWYSGVNIIKGGFTIGSYVAFAAYLAKLYGPTQIFANIGLSFQPAVVALDRISELMDLTGEEENDKGIIIMKIKRTIEFHDVSFSYDKKPILTNISFKINKGEKIVFAGPNGSGKSTIVKLMLGLYRPQRGSILFDGYDISQLSLFSLRDRFSIVSQNTFLFNDTIKNNILYSRPTAKEDEIEEAARLSGAYEFIKQSDRKFETQIGERGVRLSGGEKQKISIARAILKDSDIIIFDEATSHLDYDSERNIIGLIENKFLEKTCVIISHKPLEYSKIDNTIFLGSGVISRYSTVIAKQ